MATLPPTAATGEVDRRWQALIWAIFLASAVALLASIILWARVGFSIPPVTFYRSSWIVPMQWLLIVAPGIVGLLLGLRLRGSRVALLLSAFGLVISLENLVDILVAQPGFSTSQYGPLLAWIASTFTFPAAVTLAVLLILTFPDGRPISPNWGLIGWLVAIGCALLVPYQGFAPGMLPWYRHFPNPYAVPVGSEAWLLISRYLGLAAIVVAIIAAALSIVIRYRTADDVLRHQLRWFVYGNCLLVVAGISQIVAFVALPHDSALGELTLAAMFVGGALPAVTAAFAITRYGLYEIDVLINRTFVFGALTAVLAGLYAAGIRFFQLLFVAVTGQESDGALVLTTLVLATTFTPIKSRLEGIAARRYHPAAGAEPTPGPVDPALRALIAEVVREELARRGSPATEER